MKCRSAVILTLLALVCLLALPCAGFAAGDGPATGTNLEPAAFTLDSDAIEWICFLGGNSSESKDVHIENYRNLAGTPVYTDDPEWSLEFDDPDAITDYYCGPYEGTCTVSLYVDSGTAVGDYTGTLRCSWGGETREVSVTVHVRENPNGDPEGISGFEDDHLTIALGETVVLAYGMLPTGWTAPGVDISWESVAVLTEDIEYFYESTDAFELSESGGSISFTGLQPGQYRLDKYGFCANYFFAGHLWITVLNADGTEPVPMEHAWPAFIGQEVTARAGETYVLRFEGVYNDDISSIESLGGDWFACSEYSISGADGTITCRTGTSGYYTLNLYTWDDFSRIYFESRILIKITDEEGNLPEVRPIIIHPIWPESAVAGDTLYPYFYYYNAVEPTVWHITVRHGEEVVKEIDEHTEDPNVLFTEAGEYVLECSLTDALGRVATASATAVVLAEPVPLSVDSLEVVWIEELGPGSCNVGLRLHFTGGQGPVNCHCQIWAANGFGDWYMTWEQDSSVSPCFWLGEDGDHYFKAIVTDGTDTAEVTSPQFHVGGQPAATRLELPEDLTFIGEDAFIGANAIAVVIPAGVTGIEGNPFGTSVWYIYGWPGTYAETFAGEYGYTFFSMTD